LAFSLFLSFLVFEKPSTKFFEADPKNISGGFFSTDLPLPLPQTLGKAGMRNMA
jgi:hypothetical protein